MWSFGNWIKVGWIFTDLEPQGNGKVAYKRSIVSLIQYYTVTHTLTPSHLHRIHIWWVLKSVFWQLTSKTNTLTLVSWAKLAGSGQNLSQCVFLVMNPTRLFSKDTRYSTIHLCMSSHVIVTWSRYPISAWHWLEKTVLSRHLMLQS